MTVEKIPLTDIAGEYAGYFLPYTPEEADRLSAFEWLVNDQGDIFRIEEGQMISLYAENYTAVMHLPKGFTHSKD